jgi:hypothetical protein
LADVKDFNPYRVLRVHRDADLEEIEEAYNRLFDRYEPQAYAGDAEATRMLEDLNEARDVLVDPQRRAALDARLPRATAMGAAEGPRTREGAVRPRGQMGEQARARRASGNRPRAVAPQRNVSPSRLLIGGVAALALLSVIVFLVSRNLNNNTGSQANNNPGAAVATVNGQPIYERELNVRFEADKAQQLSDPLLASVVTQGGTALDRALDVIKQDALDKLINMEVIQQEAKAENMYPSAQTQQDLIVQAKQADVKPGQSFEDSLREHGLTEDQYSQNVVRSSVYRVMASKYMPQTGDQNSRQTAFINWICQTRAKYDVKILITFANSTGNQPCSSGLPSDIPLTGDQLPPAPSDQPPFPEPTSTGPMVPKAP